MAACGVRPLAGRLRQRHSVAANQKLFLIFVWYLTESGSFWPGRVLAGWGIGLVLNAGGAYGRQPDCITEAEIRR